MKTHPSIVNGEYVPSKDDIRVLMRFAPSHDKKDCSDFNPKNGHTNHDDWGYPKCIRCTLVHAFRNETLASELKVELSVRVKPLAGDE